MRLSDWEREKKVFPLLAKTQQSNMQSCLISLADAQAIPKNSLEYEVAENKYLHVLAHREKPLVLTYSSSD